nr:uncharacterized protein LOC106619456 [Bactrocera oleae]
MESKSSFESRNKRKLQSDAESKGKQHKGDNKQQKRDEDIRMETVIYKLDSRNKIVLPRADETNTDNDFLQYVKARIEEKSTPAANGNGRRNSKDKTKKHERTRKPKRYSYDSGTSIDEHTAKQARNSTSNGHRDSKNGRYSNAVDNEESKSHDYDRRTTTSNGCSCTRRNNSVAITQEIANAPTVNGQNFCELSEEQMLQCFQLVFKKLCTLQNANGTRLEIDVATASQRESTVNYNAPQVHNASVETPPTNTQVYAAPEATPTTQSQRYTPPPQTLALAQPAAQPESVHGKGMVQKAYFYPSHPSRDFTEPVETRILGKQFDVNNGQIANVTNGNQNENSPRQSFGGAATIIEVPQQQQYANQVANAMAQHYEQEQQPQQYAQEPSNPLEDVERHSSLTFMDKYPTEFDRESIRYQHPLRSSTQSGAAGRQSLIGSNLQNVGNQAINEANTNYPMHPYGYKNGLQKLSATSVQIIPNVTVVDCNENFCAIPTCAPHNNDSYEYILMRVKKNKTLNCNCKRG